MIDAHAHLWDAGRLAYPWLDNEPALPRTVTAADLAAVAPDLDGVVLVEADAHPSAADAETSWLTEQADALPYRAVIVAHCRLDDPTGRAARVRDLAGRPLVRGVRQGVQHRPSGGLATREMTAGIGVAAAAGLPVDVCVRFAQLGEFVELARACPDAILVLDHLGKPPIRAGAFDAWRDQLTAVAAQSNVHVKLSGLAASLGRLGDEVHRYLAGALDVFGPARCMFGGDWPVTAGTCEYAQWEQLVRAALSEASEHERTLVLDANARLLYRFADAQ